MDLKDIKAIIDLMKKNSIAEFEMEKEGFKIKLKRSANGGTAPAFLEDPPSGGGMSALPAPVAAMAPPSPAPPPMAASNEIEIKAPMVGTFYRAPSPESAPYVEMGSEVNADSVVCIIEAMKVMNEIKAEVKGVITQVLAENGKPVEFGQTLFKVRPL